MASVIFFDGVCNLCNRSVDFIIRRDTSRIFKYASLQSEFARKELTERGEDIESMRTIILLKDDQIYTRSSAILEIVRHLRFPWPALYVFKIVPRFIRDWLYNLISKNRYQWFGIREVCRVPTPEERALFMDSVEEMTASKAQSFDSLG